jgi:L-asparaginase
MTRPLMRVTSTILFLTLCVPLFAQNERVPVVFVIGTGGTISGGLDPETGRPRSLSAADLVDLVPSLRERVEIEEEDFSRIGSSSMTPEIQFRLAMRVRALMSSRADLSGIVITHGTDSLEETAFLIDLLYDDPRPVVFAAAQRAPRVSDSDGPRNLENAIRTAISPNALNMGVLVSLNEDLHAARYVTKSHSFAVESFKSGKKGLVGSVDRGKVIFYSRPLNRVLVPASSVDPSVDLVRLVAGDTGKFIRHSAQTGARGIVIEAFGRGNMPRPVAEAVTESLEAGQAVVVVSRTTEGRVQLSPRLTEAGVIEGEDLDGLKARIVLMLALGAGFERAEIQNLFRTLGGTAR